MRLVMVGPYPEPGRQVAGGVARVIDTLLKELRGRIELTLVVPSAACDADHETYGLRTIYLKRAPGPGSLAYWTADARRLASVVASLAPDLVHLQAVAGVGRLIAAPCVLTIHGIGHRDFVTSHRGSRWHGLARHGMAQILKRVELRGRKRIGHAIVINPYVAEALPDVAWLRQYPIPNPIDAAFCRAGEGLQRRPRRILCVGRIGPRKNTEKALTIAAQVIDSDPTASCTVLGSADSAEYLAQCQAIAGGRTRIAFAGAASAERLCAALDGSSVLLMTSLQETAPVAIAEAQARGVAVVGPEAFGIRHMIVPGRNGFFLPDADLAIQAACVCRALDHPWDRRLIATEAQATYSPRRVADLTLAAYRAVLGLGPARQAELPEFSSSHSRALAS